MFRVAVVACALVLSACASTPDTQTAQPQQDKEYRTGSRIPVRDPVSSSPTTVVAPPVLSQPGQARVPAL
jgi:type IV pilus biogenesis protein CpaD/CtpE